LSQNPEKIQIQIKYKSIEKQFAAKPQEAWFLVNKFFADFIPSFEIAQKLSLNVDLQQLAKDFEGIVAFSGEGANLLVPKNKLTDNEALLVWLTAYFLGSRLGMVNADALTKDELQVKLGKTGKIVSTRLGELAKNGLVQKTFDEKFRITTFGVVQIQKELVPKIKQRMNK